MKSEEKAAAFDGAVGEVFMPILASAGLGVVGVFQPRGAKGEEEGVHQFLEFAGLGRVE